MTLVPLSSHPFLRRPKQIIFYFLLWRFVRVTYQLKQMNFYRHVCFGSSVETAYVGYRTIQ